MNLTFADLRRANATRSLRWHKSGLNEWSLADWVVAAGGEVGEALNVVKKLNRDRDGQPGNKKSRADLLADLADELADAVIYLDILLAAQNDDRLGILWGVESFAAMRASTVAEFPDASLLTRSEWATGLLEASGNLATTALHNSADIGGAADEVLKALDTLAWIFDIDLAVAVVRKFNATSAAYDFPERLGLSA